MRGLTGERWFKTRISKIAFAGRCAIPGCRNSTMGAAGAGLAAFHCRKHVEHKARHGSHWHGTYSAAELKPYLAAATSYVRPRAESDRFIKAALSAIALLLEEAGPTEIATRLRGMSPRRRARIALARLRVAGVKPERFVAIVLAITALIEEDPGSHRTKEFRTVQIAKALHRLASGYHRVWELPDERGRLRKVSELHAFPRSSGQVLRIMGRAVEEHCEWVVEKHLPGVLALKKKRYGQHPRCAAAAVPVR
ncbi:hypothetical protein [Bradyrhizobium sp. CCGB20]|uniref:hypothetical protein n=1 Tax=Bradyrhizobium sp. CCGB20 TaxID=2949633 RepID=UPI0020B31BE7|nr:hypothetical protein [Bradyrhizobium sp. CCGB20]MCP3395684.1 hypothetical protein [Bradyrhizobium sp. CCGB20]